MFVPDYVNIKTTSKFQLSPTNNIFYADDILLFISDLQA